MAPATACRSAAPSLLAPHVTIADRQIRASTCSHILSTKYTGPRLKRRLTPAIKVEHWPSAPSNQEGPAHDHTRKSSDGSLSDRGWLGCSGRTYAKGCGGTDSAAFHGSNRASCSCPRGWLLRLMARGMCLWLTLCVLARILWRPILRLLAGRRSARLPCRISFHLPP